MTTIKVNQLCAMRSFPWLEYYPSAGIWGCIRRFAEAYQFFSWGLLLRFFDHKHYYISSKGEVQTDFRLKYDRKEPVMIQEQGLNHYLIPITLCNSPVFIFSFYSKTKIKTSEMNLIQFNLTLLNLYESLNHRLYPSFMIFLYPIIGRMNLVNQQISQKNMKKFIFLNGQPGTGKKTFLQCFLLFHYTYLLKEKDINGSINQIQLKLLTGQDRDIWYVPELAVLTHSQQVKIIHDFSQRSDLFIISSAYDPKMLYNRQIISQDILNLCSSNRLILPSLIKRDSELPMIISFIQSTKSTQHRTDLTTDLVKESEKKNERKKDEACRSIIKNKFNLDQAHEILLKGIESFDQKPSQMDDLFDELTQFNPKNGSNKFQLRDLITQIEIRAIKYAHSQMGNSQNKMSDFLGISRGSLQNKLRKYDLEYDMW